MVTHPRVWFGAAVVLSTILAGTTCKVVNDDHCANQDVPGNQFCRELNSATPFCSPCNRDFHGCVDFEPFACPGYSNEIAQDDGTPMAESSSTGGSSSGTDTTTSG